MTAEDPDFHRRDLCEAIDAGDAPEWRLEMQIMPFDDAADYRFNPFDLTKVWPHGDYPPIEIGRMVLDRNPENFFAEVEQAGFSPVEPRAGDRAEPGQDADGPDLLLPRHAPAPHRHQLRAAADQRAPSRRSTPTTRTGDDLPPRGRAAGLRAQLLRRPGGRPERGRRRDLVGRGGRELGRYAVRARTPTTTTSSSPARCTARSWTTPTASTSSTTSSATRATSVTPETQLRVVAYWSAVDADLGARVAAGLGIDTGSANGDLAAAREEVFAHANHA